MSQVLVTGANGFVGRGVCELLTRRGHFVRGALRSAESKFTNCAETIVVGDLSPNYNWGEALRGVDCVVHLAAKAHVLDQQHDDGEYYRVNAAATDCLALAAARAGVRRFVFMSSIKVYGDGRERAFTPDEVPVPCDVYGKSKLAAEQFLRTAASGSAMEAAIVRPPLVYGPGVRANFLRLMEWVDRGVPLPLGAIGNVRSLIALDNLCDFVRHLVEAPDSAAGTWLVSDGEDISTPELIRRIALAMRRPPRLLPVPPILLQAAATLLGRKADVARLCKSLALDISQTRVALGWQPPTKQQRAIDATASWYLQHSRPN